MKLFPRLILGFATAVLLGALIHVAPAWAADYSNSNMMDDGTFNNVNTMGNVVTSLTKPPASDYAQITNFLNGSDGKLAGPSTCLSSYTDQNWYYDGTNFHYGNDVDWNTAWGPAQVPAAQIIYTTAHMWGINPQVLISTLQKEESLITGTDCSSWRYNSAMGYGCPDSGGCNAKYAGFTKQVLWAGWQLMYGEQRSEGNVDWLGNGDITYVGYFSNGTYQTLPYKRCHSCASLPNAYTTPATIDGTTLSLANGATASLFTYTPHLNQSFPGIFEGWFGSVVFHGSDPVGNIDVVQQAPGAIRLAGWGLDRSETSSQYATINVYVDNALTGVITANASRPDVGAVYPIAGNNHGFDGTVPFTTPGTHQVCAWVVGDAVGAANYGMGCQYVTINDDTIGNLEAVQQAPSAIQLNGWGLDRSLVGAAAIHVYVDGTFAGYIMANNSRPDVGAAFASSNQGNNHGFYGTVPYTTAGTHQVCAWVVGDTLGAQIYGLGCHTITINNDPVGSLDLVSAGGSQVRVAGWGLDPSFNSASLVHVYIDGVFNEAITANISRSDVGAHGFDSTISGLSAGTHQVCAWVIGDNVGAANYGMGCKTAVTH